VVFWVVAGLFVASLVLSGLTAGVFGDGGAQVVKAVLIAAAGWSGVIALCEFRFNPMEDTEAGEWTSRPLFHATLFSVTFREGVLFILTGIF